MCITYDQQKKGLELLAPVLPGLAVTQSTEVWLFGRHAALLPERNCLLVTSLSHLCNISHCLVCEVFDDVHLALSFPLKERSQTLPFDKQGVVEKSVKLSTVTAITHNLVNLFFCIYVYCRNREKNDGLFGSFSCGYKQYKLKADNCKELYNNTVVGFCATV